MNKHNEIQEAILFLKENGYVVIKKTKDMEEDLRDCEEMSMLGKDKDCLECSCNICLTGYYHY